MIVKKMESKKKSFLGVSFDLLATGEKSMVTKMNYKIGNNVPEHCHPNEQNGYVLSGVYKIKFNGIETIITAGDSYSIPGNMFHSLEIIEPGEVVDVFTPIRKDYL